MLGHPRRLQARSTLKISRSSFPGGVAGRPRRGGAHASGGRRGGGLLALRALRAGAPARVAAERHALGRRGAADLLELRWLGALGRGARHDERAHVPARSLLPVPAAGRRARARYPWPACATSRAEGCAPGGAHRASFVSRGSLAFSTLPASGNPSAATLSARLPRPRRAQARSDRSEPSPMEMQQWLAERFSRSRAG